MDRGAEEFGDLFSAKLEALLGPRRAPHGAREAAHRAMDGEAFFHLIGKLQKDCGLMDRALARAAHELSGQRQRATDSTVPARLWVQEI
jgi:hypothetical protein